ncbi:MAG: dTMP kinase [Candidatus Omnitrophica bacterium]|nr:dTMP kinase [Candidatus Omnitrophota bacterium]
MTLDGPEGSGKSTQARWLVQWLKRQGYRVTFVRDPGSTSLGRALRQVLLHSTAPLSPLAEALLFIGGRVQLVEEKIRPALAKGRVVVCDRFHDATIVYQGYAGTLDVPWLQQLGRRAIGGTMPDLTLVLDVPPRIGFSRLKRSRDRMERKPLSYHRRVRAGYLALARREPLRINVVDATPPAQRVRNRITALAGKRVAQVANWPSGQTLTGPPGHPATGPLR